MVCRGSLNTSYVSTRLLSVCPQIIDIRVKQLQELYPQHLYFDTSFFGFLCPTTERVRGNA